MPYIGREPTKVPLTSNDIADGTILYSDLNSEVKTTLGRKNVIINGNFDIWQRATTQTSAGYGSDDRWNNYNSGSTKTHSQQAFTLGQTDVPYEPTYYSRTVVTSVAGAGNRCDKFQVVEGVRSFAGQTATLSFYAKADASKNIAIEFLQDFGSFGSSIVTGIGVTTCALTTSWQKFTTTIAIPSITGKTIGIGNGLRVDFWFDAGSDFNARTNTLGQQSGTFDIAQVQLEAGSTATTFEQRSIGEELILCQRYYEMSAINGFNTQFWSGRCVSGATYYAPVPFKVTKRVDPTVTIGTTSNSGFPAEVTAGSAGIDGFRADSTCNATSDSGYFRCLWAADAEL